MGWVGALKWCVWGGSGCGGVVWVADQWRGCACGRGLRGEGASPILGRSILYLIRGCSQLRATPHMRLLDPRMPGTPPVQRLYLKGATGASHHRGGSISQGSEHRLEGHPFEAVYMEPRVCAYGFRGHLDPNMGDPEHPIIGPPRSQGRVHAASNPGAAFLHMHCSHPSDDAWWLAAFDRTWGPSCFVDECRLSFKLSETVTAACRVGCWAA